MAARVAQEVYDRLRAREVAADCPANAFLRVW